MNKRVRQVSLRVLCAFLVLIGVGGGLSRPAVAQPPAGGVARPDYKLKVGDELQIRVLEDNDLSTRMVIPPDGKIDFPSIGVLRAEGKTIDALRNEIRRGLLKIIVNPHVVITLLNYNVPQINVLGTGIKSGGKMGLRDGWRVLDAIAAAGGLTLGGGGTTTRYELFSIMLYKASKGNTPGAAISIDPKLLFSGTPNDATNPKLDNDDTLFVNVKDEKEIQIQVVGAVAAPRDYIVPIDGGLLQILNAARPLMDQAALSKSFIQRGSKTIPLDLRGFGRVNATLPNTKLEAGDILTIPAINEFYYIGGTGQSRKVPYPDTIDTDKLTVSKAVADAGMLTERSELKAIILNKVLENGDRETIKINIEKMIKSGDYADDQEVKPGDTIFVPERRRSRGLDFFGGAQAVGILVGLFTLFGRR